MNYRVVKVEPTSHLHLTVQFADGLSGEVVLKESHLYGVFAVLKDPAFFAQAHCNNGFVEWPGDLDIAPDAMYEEIRSKGCWVLD